MFLKFYNKFLGYAMPSNLIHQSFQRPSSDFSSQYLPPSPQSLYNQPTGFVQHNNNNHQQYVLPALIHPSDSYVIVDNEPQIIKKVINEEEMLKNKSNSNKNNLFVTSQSSYVIDKSNTSNLQSLNNHINKTNLINNNQNQKYIKTIDEKKSINFVSNNYNKKNQSKDQETNILTEPLYKLFDEEGNNKIITTTIKSYDTTTNTLVLTTPLNTKQCCDEQTNDEKHYFSKFFTYNRGSKYENYKFKNNSKNIEISNNNNNIYNQLNRTELLNISITSSFKFNKFF